jgi:hypothetical protein
MITMKVFPQLPFTKKVSHAKAEMRSDNLKQLEENILEDFWVESS